MKRWLLALAFTIAVAAVGASCATETIDVCPECAMDPGLMPFLPDGGNGGPGFDPFDGSRPRPDAGPEPDAAGMLPLPDSGSGD